MRNSGLAFTTDQGPLSIIKSYDSIYTAALASTSDSLEPTVQTFLGVGVGMRTGLRWKSERGVATYT